MFHSKLFSRALALIVLSLLLLATPHHSGAAAQSAEAGERGATDSGASEAEASKAEDDSDAPDPSELKVFQQAEVRALRALAHDPHDTGLELALTQLAGLAGDQRDAQSEPERAVLSAQALEASVWAELIWQQVDEEESYQQLFNLLQSAELQDALAPAASSDEMRYLRARLSAVRGDLDACKTLSKELGFVQQWALCGPFENERAAGFNVQAGPELELPNFADAFTGKGGREVRWRRLNALPALGEVNLDQITSPNDQVMTYAAMTLENPESEPIKAMLLLASGDGVRVYLNGRELDLPPLPFSDATSENTQPDQGAAEAARPAGRNVLRGASFDQERIPLTLQPGQNLLVLKLLEDEGEYSFRARIKPASLIALQHDALRPLTRWEEHFKQAAANWLQTPEPEEDEQNQAAPSDSTASPRALFYAGLYHLLRHPADRKEKHASRLLELALKQATSAEASAAELVPILYALAQAERSTATISSGSDENRRRQLLQQVVSLDAKHVNALAELAEYYRSTLRLPERSRDYAFQVLELCQHHLGATMTLVQLDRSDGNTALAESRFRQLVEHHPAPTAFRFLGFFASARENWKQAMTDWGEAHANFALDTYAISKVLTHAVEAGEMERAKQLFRQAIALQPTQRELYQIHARLLSDVGHHADALSATQDWLALNPQDSEMLKSAAEYADRMAESLVRKRVQEGRELVDGVGIERFIEQYRQLALGFRKQSLAADPSQSRLARYLDYREGAGSHWEELLQSNPADYIARGIALGASKLESEDPYAISFQETITHVMPDGTSQRFFQIVLTILNEEGLSLLPFYRPAIYGDFRVMEAKAYNAEGGNTLRVSDGWVDTTGMQAGDTLHMRARALDGDKGFFGDVYYSVNPMVASFHPYLRAADQRGCEISLVHQTYVLPSSRDVYVETLREDQAARFVRSDQLPDGVEADAMQLDGESYRLVRFTADSMQRVEDEPLGPDPEDVRPTVYLSTFKDWKAFGEWYRDLIAPQLIPSPALSAKTRELTRGKSSEEAKVRAIYHWVVQNIRYNADWHFGEHGYKPFEAGVIFDRCIGDCKDKAILICTMLEVAGITAWPVIINLEGIRGPEDMPLAMPLYFNHAIACVEYADGSRVFLDGTATYNAYDEFPSGDAGARVVVVTPEGGELVQVPIPPAEQNRDQWEIAISLSASGDAQASITNAPRGDIAASWRSSLESNGSAQEALASWLREGVPAGEISLNDAQEPAIDRGEPLNLDQALSFSFQADLKEWAKVDGSSISFTPCLSPNTWSTSVAGMLAERTQPLYLPAPWGATESVRISLPEGYTVDGELPSSVELQSSAFRYSMSFQLEDEGRVIRMQRAWHFTATQVMPEDYTLFREALVKSDAMDTTSISLKQRQEGE